MATTTFKNAGNANTNPVENKVRKEIKVKVGPAGIARIVFLNSDDTEANSVKQFVNLSASDSSVDGKIVPNIYRAGNKIRLKVFFNKPGTYPFMVKCEPLDGNAQYTPGELARNARFAYQKEQKSYTTGSDGSLALPLEDFFVGAAGKDKYVFRATDASGVTVSTGILEVHRLIYYVELKMRSLTTCAASLALVEQVYAKHHIKLLKLPAVEMAYMPNIGDDDVDTFHANAMSAYSESLAVEKQPHVIAIAYTGHLAVKRENFRVLQSVGVGSGSAPALITIAAQPDASTLISEAYFLWQGLEPGESWFVSARFIKAGGSATDVINIPREKCRPVPSSSASPQEAQVVQIDVSALPHATGTIELVVNIVDQMKGGISLFGGNLICVCTKAWWSAVDAKMQNEVVVHELGHKMGMAPDGRRKLPDKTDSWYDDAKGHRGNHCFYGLSASQTRYDSDADVNLSKCVMYGATNGHSDFCVNCAPAVRKVDLSDGWEPF
jgi:type VI secretion system secreted protein VgrG